MCNLAVALALLKRARARENRYGRQRSPSSSAFSFLSNDRETNRKNRREKALLRWHEPKKSNFFMDRSRKSRNVASSSWTSVEVARQTRRRFAWRFRMTVIDFRSILIFIALMLVNVSSSYIPEKYPIEVYHMLQERTQFGIGRENRVRGTWGTWSSWSECSRTCGTGIQSQSRECVPLRKDLRKRSVITDNGMTQNKRPICIGTYKRYHTCNTQECPNFAEDLRAEQCARYNGRNYKGHIYTWIPFLDAPNSCALNCRAVGQRFYATLEPAVMDGTPCDGPNLRGHNAGISMERTERWLCVAGQCKSVGCDGVIGSGATMDACGVCGGRGQGCRLFEGIFMEPILPKGHHSITTIPKGAMSLNISELRFSANFLALRDSNGSYVLNGPWSYSPSGTYKAAGTTLTYQRGDRNRLECILATGPLNDSLQLEILFQELNPGVLYKYMLPLKDTLNGVGGGGGRARGRGGRVDGGGGGGEGRGGRGGGGGGGGGGNLLPPIFNAISSNDQRGNEIPDGGSHGIVNTPPTRTSIHRTDFSQSRGFINHDRTRHASRTEEMKRPPTIVMAGDQPNSKTKKKKRKKFVWKVATACSKECGGGIQTSIWTCVREDSETIAHEKRCRNSEKPVTSKVTRCNEQPCPARWRADNWSECSVTCGVGRRTRKLECVQELNSRLTMRVALGACVQPPDLKTVELCSKPACPITNTPELRNMEPLSVSIASSSTAETYSQSTQKWNVGTWSPCSTSCGKGFKTRTVTCITSGEACPLSSKPSSQEECDNPSCLVSNKNERSSEQRAPWLYSAWSPTCSTECGKGIENRRVACSEGSELFCDPKEKPETERQCFGSGINCDDAKWFTGPWTSCSVSCGIGVQYRDVICISKTMKKDNGEYTVLEMKNCNGTKPRNEQACEAPPCSAEWYISDWSQCSVTCGSGVQKRLVRCILEGISSSNCKEFIKPNEMQRCNMEPCKKDITLLNKSPKILESSECVDKYPDCDLVVKSGLCHRKYYKHSCCRCRD
ncbi:ADAMTS-like protein 4 isoform X3 [Vespa velutina]|uniref:ADAMTS-like protein 4 isoform X3 n=1 Tax=Vespa velutina TaxID=202808 RepID=UPI001FB4D2E0|nr:ADAMTS-like protein 4 isoform X3 [Vespa velutina]